MISGIVALFGGVLVVIFTFNQRTCTMIAGVVGFGVTPCLVIPYPVVALGVAWNGQIVLEGFLGSKIQLQGDIRSTVVNLT